MDDRVSVARPWFPQYGFRLVDTMQKLKKLVDICVERKLCSLDLETSGVDNRVYKDEFFADGVVTRNGMRTVDRIVGACVSFDGQHGYYIPLSHEPEDSENLPWDEAWDELTRLVNGARCIFHNAKFDCEFLYPVTGKEYWGRDEYEDTFLLYRVHMPLKNSPAGLKPLSKLFFGIEMVELDELFTPERKEQLKREKRGYNFGMLHPKEGLEYGSSDGIFTYKLFHVLRDKINDQDLKIYTLEKAFCNVLRKMERNRVHVDVERVQQLYTECKAEIEQVGDIIREVIERHTGQTTRWMTLKVGSPKQLSQCFFTDSEGLGLKPTKKMLEAEAAAQGGHVDALAGDEDDDGADEDDGEKVWSLKDEALKSLHEDYGSRFLIQREGVKDRDGKPRPESIFELIVEWRHYDKMKGSFVEKLFLSHDKYGDVRPNFNQMGTDTARLSSTAGKIEQGYSGINFQGIPRDSDEDKPELFKQIRTCIVPRDGWMLVKLDFAGEELRVVTNLSGDKVWTKSFLYEDGDVHAITARTLFRKDTVNKDERNRGKRSNFAFIYGGGAGAIMRNVDGCGGIRCSMEDAQCHMDNLKRDVPELMGYVDHQKHFARKHKCIFTAFGRKIPIPTIDSPIRGIRAKAERCAINYTIQATSADILKFAMCFVDKNIRALGWEDRVRYVLTVHDEVVFEIRPQHMMEIVRKLDEWMTFPWKLPKAHGREWIVPLLTEPGIDINWKARYNYFEMVDGVVPLPKDLNEDGSYKGKVKKGYYFHNGRLYQEIPDFLKEHIMMLPQGGVAPQLPPAETAVPEAAVAGAPEPVQLPPPSEKPNVPSHVETSAPPVESSISFAVDMEISLDTSDIPMSSGSNGEIGFGDLPDAPDDDSPRTPAPPPSRPPEPAPVARHEVHAPAAVTSERPAPAPPPAKAPEAKTNGKGSNGIGVGQKVHRWVFRGVPCEYTQKKLYAIITLAEGDTPLRIVSLKGEVMVPESEGILVNPNEFDTLARLFGLG